MHRYVSRAEIMDFGIPQNSEPDTLKMYITNTSFKSEQAVREDSAKISIQATGAVGWRRQDVKYRKNEVFVDVIETVNMLMSASGTVLRADVDGQIMMRAYLSGTPECRFGLNDKLMLEKKCVEIMVSIKPGKVASTCWFLSFVHGRGFAAMAKKKAIFCYHFARPCFSDRDVIYAFFL